MIIESKAALLRAAFFVQKNILSVAYSGHMIIVVYVSLCYNSNTKIISPLWRKPYESKERRNKTTDI